MNKILLATALSDQHAHLLERAVELSATSGAELHILHVYNTIRLPGGKSNVQQERKVLHDTINTAIKQQMRGNELDFTIHIVEGGRVNKRIRSYAEHISADLIVLGYPSPSEDIPAEALGTLDKVLLESDFPVLIASERTEAPYSDIAIYGVKNRHIKKAAKIVTPLLQDSGIQINGYLVSTAQSIKNIWPPRFLKGGIETEIFAKIFSRRNYNKHNIHISPTGTRSHLPPPNLTILTASHIRSKELYDNLIKAESHVKAAPPYDILIART